MYTRDVAIKMSKSFLADCTAAGITINKAIMFGSVAKNSHGDNSDIDIALISNLFSSDFILNNEMTSKINIKYPLLEIHHFNYEYYKKSDPFIDEINKTGIIIQ